MNHDYVHVSMLLDGSGSMDSIKSDVLGGFNNFIKEQQALPGKMTFTMAKFNTGYELLHDAAEIQAVKQLMPNTYNPMGGTALLDSAKKLIIDTGKALASMKESERPGKVMVVMITDGEENSSKDTTKEQLLQLIKHQKDVYQWDFVYLGADQDAFHEAGKIGATGVQFSKAKFGQTVNSYSANVRYNRSAASGQSVTTLTQDEVNAAGGND